MQRSCLEAIMIIKGTKDPLQSGRISYDFKGEQVKLNHFVVRIMASDNPFKPHKHEKEEVWYIIDGTAVYLREGKEHEVEGGDLIHIKPWVEHGLSTLSRTTWICLG